MKPYLILLAIFLLLGLLWQNADAQRNDVSSFLSKDRVQISGFGGPFLEISSIDNKANPSMGAELALLIDQKFFIGCYGIGTKTSVKNILPEYQEAYLSFVHRGFWIGYINSSNQIVNVGFNLKVGGGELDLYKGDSYACFSDEKNKIDEDGLFVLTPEANIDFNIATWMKATLGLGYRYVSGINTDYYNNSNLRSLEGSLGFYFRLIQSEE